MLPVPCTGHAGIAGRSRDVGEPLPPIPPFRSGIAGDRGAGGPGSTGNPCRNPPEERIISPTGEWVPAAEESGGIPVVADVFFSDLRARSEAENKGAGCSTMQVLRECARVIVAAGLTAQAG